MTLLEFNMTFLLWWRDLQLEFLRVFFSLIVLLLNPQNFISWEVSRASVFSLLACEIPLLKMIFGYWHFCLVMGKTSYILFYQWLSSHKKNQNTKEDEFEGLSSQLHFPFITIYSLFCPDLKRYASILEDRHAKVLCVVVTG